jgi:hypothetical protein
VPEWCTTGRPFFTLFGRSPCVPTQFCKLVLQQAPWRLWTRLPIWSLVVGWACASAAAAPDQESAATAADQGHWPARMERNTGGVYHLSGRHRSICGLTQGGMQGCSSFNIYFFHYAWRLGTPACRPGPPLVLPTGSSGHRRHGGC